MPTESQEAKRPEGGSDLKRSTVSRGAYFGGLLVGGGVLAGGLYVSSMVEGRVGTILLEMVAVGLAMLVTTAIWRRSARNAPELDSPDEPRDGR